MYLIIYRSAVLPAFLFFLSIASHPLQAQNVNWQVISNSTDAVGNTTIVERASSGQKRETKISYYPGTNNVWTQTQTDLFVSGARKVTHKAWTQSGTQKEEYYVIFEGSGAVRSSDRWFIDSIGRRYFEKWDNERRGWVPLRNDDGPKVTTTRNKIRIRYAASRTADAHLAFQKLTQKGFSPTLVSIPEGEGQVFIRGLQFYRDSDSDNARDIAQTLREIEYLTPHFLGPMNANDHEPSDRHFDISLYAKKKPLVRIGHTAERKDDAVACETALELLGFYVDLVLVNETDVGQGVKGILFYHRPEDRPVADSMPRCITDPDEKLVSKLRKISTERNPPDFQFVLTDKVGRNFSYSREATPSAPNEVADINERLRDVRENRLKDLAPGTGVAHINGRNAEDKVWDVRYRYVITDIASGREVRCGGSWENCILPQGSYRITNFLSGYGSSGKLDLRPVEFTVRAGAITMVTVGGRHNVGRVIFEPRDLNGAVTDYFATITRKDHPTKWWQTLNKLDGTSGLKFADLPPGVYRVRVRYATYLTTESEDFTVEAGQTVVLRSINRGRLAVRNGDGPNGGSVAVDKVALLDNGRNEFVDVPAGNYRVYAGGQWKQIFLRPNERLYLRP